jgi:hypothetical protein
MYTYEETVTPRAYHLTSLLLYYIVSYTLKRWTQIHGDPHRQIGR